MNTTEPGIKKLHDLDISATESLDAAELEKLWTEDAVRIINGNRLVGLCSIKCDDEWELGGLPCGTQMTYCPAFQTDLLADGWAVETGTVKGHLVIPDGKGGSKEVRTQARVVRVLRRQQDETWKICWLRYDEVKS